MVELGGRTALITGGTQGLGSGDRARSICARDRRRLRMRARPRDVEAAHGRSCATRAGAGQRVLGEVADVSSPEDVERLVAAAMSGLGGPDDPRLTTPGSTGRRGRSTRSTGRSGCGPSRSTCSAPCCRRARSGRRTSRSAATARSCSSRRWRDQSAPWSERLRGLQGRRRALRRDARRGTARAPRRRQRDRAGALNTRMLDEVLAAGPERGRADASTSARSSSSARGGVPLERGAELAVLLGLGGQRRRHGKAAQRGLGSVDRAARIIATTSTPTCTR